MIIPKSQNDTTTPMKQKENTGLRLKKTKSMGYEKSSKKKNNKTNANKPNEYI